MKLDLIQNYALRLAVGGFKSTPIEVLEAETCVLPLQFRRVKANILRLKKILQHDDKSKLMQQYDQWRYFYRSHPNAFFTRAVFLHVLNVEPSHVH